MKVRVSFPHTKDIYIDCIAFIEVVTGDTRQDIIDRAIEEIGKGQFIFDPYDGYKKEPSSITLVG